MTAVYYFSGSGHSRAVAEYLARKLDTEHIEITDLTPPPSENIETTVIVFPVYCQNIPAPIIPFLKNISTPKTALIATYGGISRGNVIFEASKLINSTLTACAYVKTEHSYLSDSTYFDKSALSETIKNITLCVRHKVIRLLKNPFADFFPAWRSRVGVRIKRLDTCTSCGKCTERCPMKAINNGIPSNKCIRCLRCVSECPSGALEFSLSPIMNSYLNR